MRPLFLPPVVIAMLLGALAVDAWLLAHTNLIAAIDDLLRQELHLPLVIGLVLLSGLFHECGHATALRYGGATPGAIGGGIYIIWPVFYSDVTDAYRLDRRGRLRVDLGGVYFQCIFALATAIGSLATGFEPLLLVTFFQYVSIAQQFIPFLRLDGYYVISDLIGVPELFSHVRPTLSSLFRRSAQGQPANELRSRWASLAVTAWVALTVPALALFFAYIVAYTPWIFTTSFDLLHERLSEMMAANGSPISASAAALRVALGLVPVIGLSVLYLRIAVVSVRFLSRIRLRPRSRRAIARLYLRIAVASSRLLSRIRLSPRVRTSLNPGDLGGAERRISEATVLTIVLAVLVLAAVIVIGRGSQQAEGPVQEPAAEQKEQPAEEPAAGSETNSVDERTNEQPADSSATSETVQVTVRALGDPAGLTILTDGMVAADPLAQPGYAHSFEAQRVATVSTANAGAVEVEVSGQNLGRLGSFGQPVTRDFTPPPPEGWGTRDSTANNSSTNNMNGNISRSFRQ